MLFGSYFSHCMEARMAGVIHPTVALAEAHFLSDTCKSERKLRPMNACVNNEAEMFIHIHPEGVPCPAKSGNHGAIIQGMAEDDPLFLPSHYNNGICNSHGISFPFRQVFL